MKFLLNLLHIIFFILVSYSSYAKCNFNCSEEKKTTSLIFEHNSKFNEKHLNFSSTILGKDLGFGHRWETKSRRRLKEWNISIVKDSPEKARLGTSYLRFETREGHCTATHGKSGWDDCKKGRNRAEIQSKWKNEVKPNRDFWHFFSLKIPSSIEQKKGVKTSIWQIHSGKLAGPSWMIRFTKNSGLKIENHTAFPPDEKVIIDRKNLFDKWHDVVIKANLSKEIKGSFKIWVNGKKQFDYKGISRQSTAVRDPIDLGIYNTGSRYGDRNMNGKDLGNIVVLFDEIRVGDSCKDLKLEDFKYECSALN